MKHTLTLFTALLLSPLAALHAADKPENPTEDKVRARYAEMLQRVAADPARYTEKWRPQYHFSAPEWIIGGGHCDPCGLVFFNGKYRMPFLRNGWENAVSTDLVHWQLLPQAIGLHEVPAICSGAAAVDWNDTSGFFGGKPGLLALFAYPIAKDGTLAQGIAFSRDGGDTWQRYEGNPVIPNYGTKVFLDPKIFWYEPTRRWIAFIGGHGKMRIYSSPNARQWDFESVIDKFAAGGHTADVFQLPVNGDPNNLKWVWSNTGTKFVVGTFDGHKFTPETDFVYLVSGPDVLAAQSWSDMPATDGRRVFIQHMCGPMFSWKEKSLGIGGSMTLPREWKLLQLADGKYKIAQIPIRELEQLREKTHTLTPRTVKAGETPLPGIRCNTLEIVAEFKLGTAKRFGFKIFKGKNEETLVGYDAESKRMFLDRANSGYVGILNYAKTYDAELLPADNRIKLHVFADVSTVELFGNEGIANMTAMVLPSPASKDVALFAEGGEVELARLDVHELKSIWGGKPVDTGKDAIAAGESNNPFESQFVSNLKRWVPSVDAAWRFVAGGLEGRGEGKYGVHYVAETRVMNCTLEADMTLEVDASAGLSIRDQGTNGYSQYRKLTLDRKANTLTFNEANHPVDAAKLGEAKLPLSKEGKYHLKVEAIGAHYRVWLNGTLVMEADDAPQCPSSAGYPVLCVHRGGAVFQNVLFKEIAK